MFVALWPKADICESYVAVLLLTYARATWPCCWWLPPRVELLQARLERVEDWLLAMKQARARGASCIAKFPAGGFRSRGSRSLPRLATVLGVGDAYRALAHCCSQWGGERSAPPRLHSSQDNCLHDQLIFTTATAVTT
jgi:hypothetical protein